MIALERVVELLGPRGILRVHDLIYDFDPTAIDTAMDAWFAGAVADSARGWTADELAEHVRTEFSTYSWLFEAILARSGLETLDRNYVRSVYGAYTCRKSG